MNKIKSNVFLIILHLFSTSFASLVLFTLSTPIVSFAATSPSSTGNTTNVTQTVPDSVTLASGFLTIDGATTWNFQSTQIETHQAGDLPYGTTIHNNVSDDVWVPASIGTQYSKSDEITANLPSGTISNSNFAPAGSLFSPTLKYAGVQITDSRGTDTGWSLYAYPSNLISSKGYILYGATIGVNPTGSIVNDALDKLPTYIKAQYTINYPLWIGNVPESLNPALEVASSGSTPQPAPELNATGTSQIPFANLTLWIPSGVPLADTYTGTITWDLTTAP
ncbi:MULTISPECIES: WxL domain-containing protein [unclassified Lactococcus]|uniref:WxL domain-containing protein n=1 Tax=unclassified Lactococcus TaxID=2643510 RepID=UPI0011CB2283|nr:MULTISPECIES: WxL domain-containing protein [unclassified Lactococcus]MQW22669.1 hypothetical protein [Lactococcus sp. dk101]TXK44678.1 hypothetical protein FVP42_03445 [Lactococcus sp. dk310]TXK50572.1 hypothetical protein FVP43_03445 [Lactococcus sp. dk322]